MFEYLWNIMRSGESKATSEPRQSELVSETLFEELNSRIKEADCNRRQRMSQLKRDSGIPDYSWLVSNSDQPYKIPNMLRIELEDLASQIEPDDTCHVISCFRKRVNDETPVEEIVECFKDVLKRRLVVKNLRHGPKNKDKAHTLQNFNEPSSYFKFRNSAGHLREQTVKVNIDSTNEVNNARVSSAPASSWRFFRQSKIKPLNTSLNNAFNESNDKERRANSVPTITTIV